MYLLKSTDVFIVHLNSCKQYNFKYIKNIVI